MSNDFWRPRVTGLGALWFLPMPGLDVGGEYLCSDQDTVSFIKRGMFYAMHSVGHNANVFRGKKCTAWKDARASCKRLLIAVIGTFKFHRHPHCSDVRGAPKSRL